MPAKTVNKLSDKMVKISETLTINMYDNGFLVDANGRNKKNDPISTKIVCNSIDEVIALVREASEMERSEY